MDPQHQPPVPVKKTILIVNQFITQTTRFLNHFSTLAEEKLQKVFHDVNRIETTLVLLESRLLRLDGFDDMAVAPATNSSQPAPAAAAGPAAGAAAPLPAVAGAASSAAPPPPQPAAQDPATAAAAAAAAAPPPPPVVVVVKCKDDPVLSPYFKLLRLGAAPQAVKMKMAAEGNADPSLLDLDPESASPLTQPGGGGAASAAAAAAAPPPAPAPAPQAPQSLAAPPPPPLQALMPPPPVAAMSTPPPAARPPVVSVAAAAPPPPPAAGGGGAFKDDPSYAPFFRMLKVGVPPDAVRLKVAAAGLNPAAIEG